MSDKVYTSSFSGAQIDEAVDKVINGDIEGSNIKEGSIPLSALADDVKDKLNNIFIMPEDFVEEEYNEPDEDGFFGKIKQVYVTDILENRYNKINIDGVLGDINIADGLIDITTKSEIFLLDQKQERCIEVFIRVQDCKFKQLTYLNKSPFVTLTDVANINGDIRYNFVKSVTNSEITIPEENKQLFKKNMGSFANWNAQQGEAGYIENKPFSKKHISKVLNDYNYDHEWGRVIHAAADGIESINVTDENIVFTSIGNYELTYPFYVPKILGNYTVTNKYGQQFTLGVVDYDNSLYVEIYGGDEDILHIEYDIVSFLSSAYIDDTVIKTTPQTLSNTDKNQALANLGIDPVVWKYICKPLPINDKDTCPKELLDEQGNLKYQIPSMYIVHYNGEYYGPISWIDKRGMGTFYNNGSYFEVNLDDNGYFSVTEMTN